MTDETACTNLRRRARFQDAIVPVRTRYQESDALNFLISETDYPKNLLKNAFPGCSVLRGTRSNVVIKPALNERDIEACFLSSSLIHLGFSVDEHIYKGLNKGAFKDLIDFYTRQR